MFTAWKLKKIRVKEQRKLDEKNLALYKNITSHMKESNLTADEKEEVLQQIMDMMLQAQKEDKSIDLFIGDDYEVFCNSIIEEFNNSKNVVYKILNYIQKYLIETVLILIVMVLGTFIKNSSFPTSITVDQFILASAISIAIIPFSKNKEMQSVLIPVSEKINFSFRKVKNQNASFIVLMVILISRFGPMEFFASEFLNSNIVFSIIALGALLIIATIEIYKKAYNKA